MTHPRVNDNSRGVTPEIRLFLILAGISAFGSLLRQIPWEPARRIGGALEAVGADGKKIINAGLGRLDGMKNDPTPIAPDGETKPNEPPATGGAV